MRVVRPDEVDDVVSAGGEDTCVVTWRAADSPERLPAASTAETVYEYVVLGERPVCVKVVPVVLPAK